MNRIAVAQKLVKLARELMAIEFPTQDAMDKYLKEHPGADRSLHRVVKTEKAPEDMTPDEVEEVLKKKMGPAYKPQEQRIKEQTEKWNNLQPAKPAAREYDFANHVRDLVTKYTEQGSGISHSKLVEILGRFGNKKSDIDRGLKSLAKDGYMKRGKDNRWHWNVKGEF